MSNLYGFSVHKYSLQNNEWAKRYTFNAGQIIVYHGVCILHIFVGS